MKKALITGITGQDGSYLAELLLEKGYEVHGLRRRTSLSTHNLKRIAHLDEKIYNANSNLHLHYGDLTDTSNLTRLLQEIKPDEIYNLAAQSHVHVSFDVPEYTANSDAIGVLRILEAIRILKLEGNIKFYQASTSEMYGLVQEVPQKETTPFYPRSPYGVAKLYGHWITINYREAYNMFTTSGILFNHESPRRGESFVTRKITLAVSNISKGKQKTLKLGNLDAKRDWGFAPEYVEAMWLILQQDKPDDYVISTGKMHSVREFVEHAFNFIGVNIEWKGKGVNEIGFDSKSGEERILIDPYYYRPSEVDILIGDSSKAKEKLGWEPRTTFEELVQIMMENDIKNE